MSPHPTTLPVSTSAARWSTVAAFDLFADGSGVSALLECGHYRFSCSWIGGEPQVTPLRGRDGNRRIPAKHVRCAEADFAALLADNVDADYRRRCAALYQKDR